MISHAADEKTLTRLQFLD